MQGLLAARPMTRILIGLCCAALVTAAACSGSDSPTSPSETGATVDAASAAVDQEVSDPQVAVADGAATVVMGAKKDKKEKKDKGNKGDDGDDDEDSGNNEGDEDRPVVSPLDITAAPVEIKKFTNGEDADRAPGPNLRIGSPVTWTYVVTNRSALSFTSLSVTDNRGVAVACPRMLPAPGQSITCTGSGTAGAGQYRNVGTVTIAANGNQYSASDASHYFGGPAGVTIEKFTNGEDVIQAPGPRIPVGSPVTWTYVITNRSTFTFTSLSVTDDRGVAVACPRLLPAPGQSLTCNGSGVAEAGLYRNVGTVVATANGTVHTDSDESFYFGRDDEDEPDEGRKVDLCHRTGNGSFHMINVSVNAEPAHRRHGDGKVGEAVPGNLDGVFTASCSVR